MDQAKKGQVAHREQHSRGHHAKRDALSERVSVSVHNCIVREAGKDTAAEYNFLAYTSQQRKLHADNQGECWLLRLSEKALNDVIRGEIERREERRVRLFNRTAESQNGKRAKSAD